MFSSLLFKTATRIAARRNITTTVSKRSSDPILGHVEQTGIPGSVSIP
jgi:hypothetical protein